jgi:hypothetical protein
MEGRILERHIILEKGEIDPVDFEGIGEHSSLWVRWLFQVIAWGCWSIISGDSLF